MPATTGERHALAVSCRSAQLEDKGHPTNITAVAIIITAHQVAIRARHYRGWSMREFALKTTLRYTQHEGGISASTSTLWDTGRAQTRPYRRCGGVVLGELGLHVERSDRRHGLEGGAQQRGCALSAVKALCTDNNSKFFSPSFHSLQHQPIRMRKRHTVRLEPNAKKSS